MTHHKSKPCSNCPFRKDSLEGWLGADSTREIVKSDSFVCHKNKRKQCAGHIILLGMSNLYARVARAFRIELGMRGHELVFDSTEDFIEHHKEKGF